MEYVQERVTTLHDFDTGPAVEDLPLDATAVVVPMTESEYGHPTTERLLETLAAVGPDRILTPLRVPAADLAAYTDWLTAISPRIEPLWCNSPAMADRLAAHGLDGPTGKGRDVWLALGLAAETHEYVVVHDADIATYDAEHVPRLLWPLADGAAVSKGYYARVENDRLFGRLFRLFYRPIVRALLATRPTPLVRFLAAFRYALAGDIGLTAERARGLRFERDLGLEVGTLCEVFRTVDTGDVVQVDLGRYEHDHRPVDGEGGLATAAEAVAAALFRAIEATDGAVDYDRLRTDYHETARRLVKQYGADARFNGLTYDAASEREQVDAYAAAIGPPSDDDRLPAWSETALTPAAVREAGIDSVPDA
jgi:glucosyl-3-phosphoglycerate synthase